MPSTLEEEVWPSCFRSLGFKGSTTSGFSRQRGLMGGQRGSRNCGQQDSWVLGSMESPFLIAHEVRWLRGDVKTPIALIIQSLLLLLLLLTQRPLFSPRHGFRWLLVLRPHGSC